MGLASRAAGYLSSAQTSHTLWLHSISRKLKQQEPLKLELLYKILQPSMRLLVLECYPFRHSASANNSFGGYHSHRDDRRLALARCQLLLEFKETTVQEGLSAGDSSLDGLVVFSLHDNAPASTLTALNLPRRTRHKAQDDGRRHVSVPTTPHDLRFIEAQAEVWVFEPFREVSLRVEDVISNTVLERTKQPGVTSSGKESASSRFGKTGVLRNPERLGKHDRDGVEESALICCRFGVVV